MSSIQLKNVTVKINGRPLLTDLSLTISPDQLWVFIGSNGSGKSLLARILSRQLEISAGVLELPHRVKAITFEGVTEVLNHERSIDNSNTSGGYDKGTTTQEFIFRDHALPTLYKDEIREKFNLSGLFDQGIKFLSTGEMRKVLICQALVDAPELLILDEPFDGLDVKSCKIVRDLIKQITETDTQVILLLNRYRDIPSETTHLAIMNSGQITKAGAVAELLPEPYSPFRTQAAIPLPQGQQRNKKVSGSRTGPVIEMRQVNVSYRDKAILKDFSWSVKQGQQWMISGPNGSGKTTLLNLITGDNTQGYANDVALFGQRKGNGESVWDIKRKIGHISTALQREYRVRGTVLSVILSGFFDSIGLYSVQTKKQHEIAKEWLKLLKMEKYETKPFQNLSFGQQRLVLLARAMVKQPELLILDEPCQGLDEENRDFFLRIAQTIGSSGQSQLLYVTHRLEDKIPCIDHHLELIPLSSGGYTGVTKQL